MIRSFIAAALAIFTAPADVHAQASVTVGPPGSGADHPTPWHALAAVPDGSVLELLPGTYTNLTIDGRTITVVGHDGAQVERIVVRNVAADQSVRVANLTVSATQPVGPVSTRITIEDTDGRVELVEIDAVGGYSIQASPLQPSGFATPGLFARNASALVLTDCIVRGGFHQLYWSAYLWESVEPGAVVRNSTIDFVDCEVTGSSGRWPSAALDIGEGSRVVMSRTTAIGGDGRIRTTQTGSSPGSGSPAVVVDGALLVVAAGEGCLVRGGAGVFYDPGPHCSGFGCWAYGTPGGVGIDAFGGSFVQVSPDAQVEGGPSGDTPPIPNEAYSFDATTLVVHEVMERPTLGFVPASAAPGDVSELRASGGASEVHLLFFAGAGVAPLDVPELGVRIHLDPLTVLFGGWLALDGGGAGSMPVATPHDPSLVGLGLVAQSLVIDPASIRISNPATLLFVP